MSIKPTSGLIGKSLTENQLVSQRISTAPSVEDILVPVHKRPSGGRRLQELFFR